MVHAVAEGSGLFLDRRDGALVLSDGAMTLKPDFASELHRLSRNKLNQELLVKAAKVKGVDNPIALDATAGLGEDSLLLAAAGFTVELFESNPVIALLLADALERASRVPELAETVSRMTLRAEDSISAMRSGRFRPDVVVLDPMFPGRTKSAAVKKKFQLLHKLETPCENEAELLEAALAARPRKIIIKRPPKGPHLAGRKPSYSLQGKAVRYDVIALSPDIPAG